MRVRVVAATSAAVLGCAASTAAASSWPAAGGDPSRSGATAQAAGLPLKGAWTASGPEVVTPVVVTSGAAPAAQRVAYGTVDGRLHLRVLETGDPVGPPDGLPVAEGALPGSPDPFGREDVAAGFAAGATRIYAPHEEGGGIEVLVVDQGTGARVGGDVPVPGSLGCRLVGSPLLTPPAVDGSRFLYFTMRGACTAGSSLLRWGVGPDGALLGQPTHAPVTGMALGTSASLVVLQDPVAGGSRFHVAVPHEGGIAFYDAGRDLDGGAPDLEAEFAAGERPQTVSAPVTAAGLVAGAEGSGTPAAAALYVATSAGDATNVRRLVQDGSAMRVARTQVLSGEPVPELAVTETMTPSGPSQDGCLVVPTSAGVFILRAEDLQVLHGAAEAPAAPPAAAGRLAVVPRAEADALAADTRTGTFVPLGGTAGATVQPAFARGLLVLGTAGGIVAQRTTDLAKPAVELLPVPALRRGRRVTLGARITDDRGVRGVVFRLGRRRLGAATPSAGFTDDALLQAPVRIPRAVRPGRRRLRAVATDAAGLRRTARRSVRVRR